ncbi:MAG: hypothetical protein FIB08_04530 [Candidatus Methanoperedens sp.]|nr:hypothetical protein [Candidatus Methanoperedens sp.]
MRYINHYILIIILLIFLIPNASAVAIINITQLTYGSTNVSYDSPAWSPDGKKIALNKNGIIHIMSADGSNITSTGQSSDYAKWTPDGSKIVFELDNSIYIMNSNGSNKTVLFHIAGNPAISPAGQYIIFDGGGPTPENGREIFIADINSTNKKRLTDYFGDEIIPSWSPDGKKIIFTTGGYDGTINIMDADGSNMTSTGQPGIYVRWSPDGKYIAFLSDRAGDMFQGMKLKHLYIMDADGTNVTQLTSGDNRWDWAFDWSPDGTHIAFGSFIPPDAKGNIFIMTLDFNATMPAPAPTAIPTITQTSEVTPTAITMQTPEVPGFSLLTVFVSISLLVLVKKYAK